MNCTAKGRYSYHEMLLAFDLFWSSELLCFSMADVRSFLVTCASIVAEVNRNACSGE